MITLTDCTVSFRQHPALHHVSGCFEAGSLTAVVGPNGAGKSTLLRAIAGVVAPSAGRVQVQAPRQKIAYLPQITDIDRGFPISVLDCVVLGFWSAKGAWGSINARQRERAFLALEAVGLQGFDKRPLGSLSIGQLQRVMFARLWVQDADLYLLDEPFSAVDATTTEALMGLLQAWHQQRRTVIAVVHDATLVAAHFPRTLVLARQVVAWGPTADVLHKEALIQMPRMAEAWDDQAPFCEHPHRTAKAPANALHD
jgi:zinc/manganese transport system ATP-binding protein